jgi:hypothetical protein
VVRIHPDPPTHGAIAQLGERLLCKQEVAGSIPAGSTTSCLPPLCAIPRMHRLIARDACVVSRNGEVSVRCSLKIDLGMTPRIKLIQLVIRMRVAFVEISAKRMAPERLGLYGQVNKRTWWMPWR